MSESIFCNYCDKELSEEKGEIAHGCLDCHYDPKTEKIRLKNQIIEKLKNALENLESGALKFYDAHYENIEWDICCSGRECACGGKPCDPEYYIYQDLKSVRTTLAEVKKMEEEK